MKRSRRALPYHDPGPVPRLGPRDERLARRGHPARRARSIRPIPRRSTSRRAPMATTRSARTTARAGRRTRSPDSLMRPRSSGARTSVRVMAEFWADGPKSETPPGHWNVIANLVADSPGFDAGSSARARRSIRSRGTCTSTWLSTAPCTTRPSRLGRSSGASRPFAPSRSSAGWGRRGSRPIRRGPRTIRWACRSSRASSRSSPRRAARPASGTRTSRSTWVRSPCATGWGSRETAPTRSSGVGWVRAVDWITYQRRTFVTPAFPAFISGHSTSSRTGAEVLASLTASPYFPGGFGEYVTPKDKFLSFEKGPVDRCPLAVGVVLRRIGRGRAVAALGEHPHFAGRLRREEGRARGRARCCGAGEEVLRRDGPVRRLRCGGRRRPGHLELSDAPCPQERPFLASGLLTSHWIRGLPL